MYPLPLDNLGSAAALKAIIGNIPQSFSNVPNPLLKVTSFDPISSVILTAARVSIKVFVAPVKPAVSNVAAGIVIILPFTYLSPAVSTVAAVKLPPTSAVNDIMAESPVCITPPDTIDGNKVTKNGPV